MWIITAWQHTSPEVTVKGVCCVTNAMDGADDVSCGMAGRGWECHVLL